MNSPDTRQHIEELKASIRARIRADPPLSGGSDVYEIISAG